MFVNAAFSCTGQQEFYESARSQDISIHFLHEYVLVNYRAIYTLMLASGINQFNQGLIIQNLLKTGQGIPREARKAECQLALATLTRMPTSRALRVLTTLAEQRVNNRATRAVIRDYLLSRPHRAFVTLKYRAKVRALATHCHLKLTTDDSNLLYHPRATTFEEPLFTQYKKALYSKSAIYLLPFTIAEGLANKHGVPRAEFLKKIEPMMTPNERRRLAQAAQRAGHELQGALHDTPLTTLCLTLLALPLHERRARLDELSAVIRQRAALEVARRKIVPLGQVALVLDCSYSSRGSSVKKNRPLAVALALSALLKAAVEAGGARGCVEFWTGRAEGVLTEPNGATSLARPLIEALKTTPDLVVIVSDGYENDPPAGVREVVRVFQERLDPHRAVELLHLNPLFDSDYLSPRPLSPRVPTMGVRDAEDLFTLLTFARFLNSHITERDVIHYLHSAAEELAHGHTPRALP